MNFTTRIKNEILSSGFANACCRQAALSAFLRTAGSVSSSGGVIGFGAVTESEAAAEYFVNLLETQYGAQIYFTGGGQNFKREKIAFECRGDAAGQILSELGIIRVSPDGVMLNLDADKYILENECCIKSYIKGAFLGGGSCTVPEHNAKTTGYHLEFVFSNAVTASGFKIILQKFSLPAKIARRKETVIVYIKNSQAISDFLAVIGAFSSVLYLTDIIVAKTFSNDINRAVNCQTGNLVKQFDASIRQIRAIEYLKRNGLLQSLPDELYKTAKSRLNNTEMSLSELAELLKITKSGLNHRLRKIAQIAAKAKENNIDKEGFNF